MAEQSPVDLDELVGLPEFYHPTVSPDGSRIALYYDVSGRNELHVIDRETGERTQVSDGEVPRDASWPLHWGPEGDRILFHRDEGGDEQNDIYELTLEGEVSRLVAPEGQGIILDATPDALLYSTDAGGQLNLYRYDFADGTSRQLTHHDQPVANARFDPAGDRIAYVANEADDLENRDVYVMDADGADSRCLSIGDIGSESAVAAWLPDGSGLLVSDDASGLSRAGIYDLEADTVRWLGQGEYEEDAVAVAPEGERVLATRSRDAATVAVTYDLDSGTGRELDLPTGDVGLYQFQLVAGGAVFADDSTAVLAHSTPSTRRQCLAYDLGAHEYSVLVDAEYGDVDPDSFVDASHVRYESEDGLEIGGLLYDPRDGPARADDATAVPGVVMVHGGPHFRASHRFNLSVQFLVSRGYAVFQPNYRGSTGRGRAFERAIHGDWGGMEQADVAEGGRWLMARDWVDADRVAVFGGSYGGYSVYCQLTQYPTLWATGIAWIGITDLHRLFEEDMPHFQHQLLTQMGDPEEKYDLWRDRSPVEHVDAMERPICIIHGVNDPRCPVEQARLFRTALEERGWEAGSDFEYTELGEEGHGSTDVEQKIRVFELLEDYLDRRL